VLVLRSLPIVFSFLFQTVVERDEGEDIDRQRKAQEEEEEEEEQPARLYGVVSVPAHLVKEEEEKLKREEATLKKDIHAGAAAFERALKRVAEQATARQKKQGKRELTEEEKERDRICRKERHDQTEAERSWIEGRKVCLLHVFSSLDFPAKR
jgi:hypothetical protein